MALEPAAVTRGLVIAVALLLVGGVAAAITTDGGERVSTTASTTVPDVATGDAEGDGGGDASTPSTGSPASGAAGGGSAGGGGASGGTSSSAPPAPAANLTPPKDGTYTYRNEGGENDGEESERTVETTSVSGGDVRQNVSGQFEGSNGNLEVVWNAGGWTWEGISAEGGGQSGSCRFQPPLRYLPQPLATGATWSYDSTCTFTIATQTATIRIVGTGKVVGAERATVGSTSVDVWKIERVGTFTVTVGGRTSNASSTSTELWSPAHGLDVRSTSTIQSDQGEQQQTRVLVSLKPE